MITLLLALALSGAGADGSSSVQSSWDGGPGVAGPCASWENGFESCQNVSWLSIPGQLALGSDTLVSPQVLLVADSVDHAYTADAADLNGDGCIDIVSGGNASTGLRVWYGDGSGGWDMEVIDADIDGLVGCDIADVNSDGHPDILCASYFGGRILLYLNDGNPDPQWSQQVITDAFDGGHDVEAADMDKDGDLDILAAAAEDCYVTWWRNDGGSPIQWHRQDIDTDEEYPCRIQAVDLDDDGCMDVVGTTYEGNRVLAWYGSGGGDPDWTEQVVSYPVYGAHSVRVLDVDNDGDPDLVVTSMNSSSLRLIRNQGGSPVQWNVEFLATQSACGYARPGDVDGDGDMDVVSSSFGAGGAWWYENNGDGSDWITHEFAGGEGIMPCALPADIDSDGDLDAVVTCMTTGKVLVCDLTEFESSGSLTSSILDTGGSPQWASIDWDADQPAGTELGVRYRTSDNASSMGDWSQVLYSPAELSGLVKRYFQYRLELQTSDPSVSPLVRSVQLNWDLTGIHGTSEASGFSVSLEGGNPAGEHPSVRVESQMSAQVELMLFDASGRAVRRRGVSLEAGTSFIWSLSGLPSGSYRVLAQGGGGEARVLPLVVLN